MIIDTANEGGKHLRKMLQILISGAQPQRLTYRIEGTVEKVYTLEPTIVRLEGKPGDPIKATVRITPEPKYSFSITGVAAKNADYIKYRLEPAAEENGKDSFILTVENQREKTGRYFDKIYLHTDSPIKPEISIGVFGFIKG